MPKPLYYSTMDSPVGPITLGKTKNGFCFVEFGEGEKARLTLQLWARKWLHHEDIQYDDEYLAEEKKQLQEYFDGERTSFEIPLDMYGTPFQKLVWNELLKIPYGETRSYKQIAEGIYAPRAVRAIGGANHRNPISIIVPCHRVIGSNGALIGYGGGLPVKEYLLNMEKENSSSKEANGF